MAKQKKKRHLISLRTYLIIFLSLFLASAIFSYREFSAIEFYSGDEKREAGGGKGDESADHPDGKGLIEGLVPEKTLIEARTITGKTTASKRKIAVVIDDLGPNRTLILPLLDLQVPLTLSILPEQPYSSWIADQGVRRGHEIIAHIPMEAGKEYRLGKGGLITSMSEQEILRTLDSDLRSVPHAKGVSNHMGSLFTADRRAMDIAMSYLHKKDLFFLDSFTSPRSVGTLSAKKSGVRFLRRDIFLDNGDDPENIESQWEKAVEKAGKNGYAIVLAHPRNNTIEFLTEKLSRQDVDVVPLSRLVSEQ